MSIPRHSEQDLTSDFIPVFTSHRGEAEAMRAYQAVMDAWTADYQEVTVPTSFGLTHVIVSGPAEGPPVVLLHALLATAASWYLNAGALSQTFRTYAVDVIGEANKSRPTKPIASLEDFLGWFTELIDGLGIDTLYLVGNSYGGFTGAYYAMKLPERVRKLVLIGPASTIDSMKPFMTHMFLPKAVYQTLPWLPGGERVMRRSVDWMRGDLPRDPLWEPLFCQTMINGRLINQVFPRVFSKDEFAEIRVPVLLILGEREVIYTSLESAVEKGRELIPGVEVELIPGGHHITAVAQPDLVNQRMLRFLLSDQVQ
jgi:pimeloyl-ACP methyl ester carboxylesterase